MSTTINKKWNKFDTAWVLNLFGMRWAQGYYFYQFNAGDGRFLAISGNGYLSRTNDIFCASWFGLFSFCLLLTGQ